MEVQDNHQPKYLLQNNPAIWLTFLMKVYYKSLTWMIRYKGKEMRNCHIDSDWHKYIHIPLHDWLEILNKCMIDTITEKKIRRTINIEQDKQFNQIQITKLQLLVVVSELFCIKGDSIHEERYVVHWKNHFHPEQIYASNKFIWWIYQYSDFRWTFHRYFKPSAENNTTVTFTNNDRYMWNPRYFRVLLE